jgi:hypothetical protein
MTCDICELKIKDEDWRSGKDGLTFHRICFDICVASLTAELEAEATRRGIPFRIDERGRKLYTYPPLEASQ